MLIPPALVQMVRAIGGPTGPFEGPIGPTGRAGNLLLDGAIGATGPLGAIGLTGPAGRPGLMSTLIGPTGHRGPTASMGYEGAWGVTGTEVIVPPERFQYYENTTGYVDIPYNGRGGEPCNFLFTPRNLGTLFVAFSGLVKTDNIPISIVPWVDSAGHYKFTFTMFSSVLVNAPGQAVPFFMCSINRFFQETTPDGWAARAYDEEGNLIPMPPLNFDLHCNPQRTSGFDFANHGSVININCIIMEF